jgi:hypothetical protein
MGPFFGMIRLKDGGNANMMNEDPLVPSSSKLGKKISTMNFMNH